VSDKTRVYIEYSTLTEDYIPFENRIQTVQGFEYEHRAFIASLYRTSMPGNGI
jgi:hypothetical protein